MTLLINSELVLDCLMLKFPLNIFIFNDGKFSIIISYLNNDMKTKIFQIMILAIIILPNYSLAQLAQSPWPMFQHDPQHTGRSSFNGPNAPQIKWIYETEEEVSSSPVIGSDGTIYFVEGGFEITQNFDSSAYLVALDPNGTLKWKFQLGANTGITSPAIGEDGTIYIHRTTPSRPLFGQAAFIAINSDGTLKWKYEATELFSPNPPSPAISDDGTIYVPFAEMFLYAFSPSGEIKWIFSSPTISSINSSPAIGIDGTIYVTDAASFLYAIDNQGSLKWQYELSFGSGDGSPCVGSDGTIYVSDYNDSLCAINPNGSLKWKLFFICRDHTPAIGSDGTIYIGGTVPPKGGLYAIDPNGIIKWRNQYGSMSSYTVIDENSTIYVRMNNSLAAINPDGTEKWIYLSIKITEPFSYWSALIPTISIGSDGTLYVTSARDEFLGWGINGIYALENLIPPNLVHPLNGADDVSLPIIFKWNVSLYVSMYRIQISTDSLFNSIIIDFVDGIGNAEIDTFKVIENLTNSTKYFWRMKFENDASAWLNRVWTDWSEVWQFTTSSVVGVFEEVNNPLIFFLSQNYPNPFNPTTTINYTLPQEGYIELKIFDIKGMELETLVNRKQISGKHNINWNGYKYPSGTYFYQLTTPSFTRTKKMVLIK